jgi:protein-S-isoprenylcysteine O-methyltransferase Ste14
MSETIAAIVWAAGMLLWLAIRYPHQLRARKIAVVAQGRDLGDRLFLAGAAVGLSLFPLAYVLGGFPAFADYAFRPWMGWAGTILEVSFIWLFFEAHRALGRNWSVTLEIRDKHRLVTGGLYRYVRHPMYASFWLWAIAQALLIPNWIAGLAGLAGVAGLYFSRIGKEERLMEQAFGEEYRAYQATTGRVIPKLL